MKNKTKIGAHVNFIKPNYLLDTVKQIHAIGANVGAIFVGSPRSHLRSELDLSLILQAQKYALENNIDLENFVVHAPYLINLANSNSYVLKLGIELAILDCKRTEQLGIKYFNIHPGSNSNKKEGIKIIANSINQILDNTSKIIILLETTTAKGSLIGGKFEELRDIINLVNKKNRIGVCLDSVHVWDAGYDIKNNYENVFLEFDKVVGLNYLKAFHISDSKNDIGSNSDRHENIGKGFIGLEFFKKIAKDLRFINIPKILETPGKTIEIYKNEIDLILERN